jgi:bifunctional non-homologous end joining protein LigD
MGDAPWPPHYRKQAGEPDRVQPSRRRSAGGRRQPSRPLVEIARASRKQDALDGLERWKKRHPDAASHLEPADVLVDSMRGRFHTWTRIRVNLQHVPENVRPMQEALDPDDRPDDWGISGARRTPSRARRES